MRANNVYDISSPPEDPMRSVTPRSTGGLTDTPSPESDNRWSHYKSIYLQLSSQCDTVICTGL
jgi:hypothetical protein